MTEQQISEIEQQLKNAVGRIVLLENALGTIASNLLPADVVTQLISHLEIVHSDLMRIGLPPVKASILSALKDGNGKGPGASIVSN